MNNVENLLLYYKNKYGEIDIPSIYSIKGNFKRCDREYLELNMFHDMINYGTDTLVLDKCISDWVVSYIFSNSKTAMEERFLKLQEILLENKILEFSVPLDSFKKLSRLKSILAIFGTYDWKFYEIEIKSNKLKFKKYV